MAINNTKPACLGIPMPEGPTGPSAFSAQAANAAGATAGIVNHLTDRYTALKLACYELLDTVKRRVPQEDRSTWRCPHFQKISDLIDFK